MMHNMGACVQQVCESASTVRTSRRFVDLHCHCLPNLDGGRGSIGEALMSCRALADDNIDSVIATPHQLGRFEMLSANVSPGWACLLCMENPARVLQDQSLVPVPLDERQGIW